MSKCQTCEHFSYRAGVDPRLAKKIGINAPCRPTCYCNYAGVSWERYSAVVRKPVGIKCNYDMRDMTCDRCGKKLKNTSDIWLILDTHTYICKKCGKKRESEGEEGDIRMHNKKSKENKGILG